MRIKQSEIRPGQVNHGDQLDPSNTRGFVGLDSWNILNQDVITIV